MESKSDKPEATHSSIYLLRTVQQHHVQLSTMADNKAGVLLGASFVSLTILAAWASTGEAKYAAITMAISVLFTAFFSALSLIPRSHSIRRRKEKRNVLFFGVFAHMKYEEFEDEMMGILQKDEDIFRALVLDIYSMGVVQHQKKYKYLRYSYLSFIFGLIVSPTTAFTEFLLPILSR